MANEIVRKQMDVSAWTMIQSAAPMMHRSHLFNVANEEQAVAIMIKGYEMGLGFSASFELIQVIQGKPTLIPRGALALAYQSGLIEKFSIIEKNDDKGAPYSCVVSGRRKGGTDYTVEFTMDDARRADLVKAGSGWEKYPKNMLKWRAIGFWLDIVLPDVQGGLKRSDELGASVDEAGDIIDVVEIQQPPMKVAQIGPSIEEILNNYDPEVVQSALDKYFGGNLPTSTEQMLYLEDMLKSM